GRINAVRYGNDPVNWRPETATGSAGEANSNPPLIFSGTFGYPKLPTIRVKFSKDVGASLGAQSISVNNLTTGQELPPAQLVLTYDAATQTATWELPASLADGNSPGGFSPANGTDGKGQELDGNGDGTGGDGATFDFYPLGADATHDR